MSSSPLSALSKPLSAVSGAVNRIMTVCAVGFLVAMIACVILQVAGRYIFFSAPAWTEEAARYAMIWASLLGATVAFYEKSDPVLACPKSSGSFLAATLIGIAQRITPFIFIVPILAFAPAFVARSADRVTEALEWNAGLVVSVIPLCFFVIALHGLAQLLEDLAGDAATDLATDVQSPIEG